MIFLINCSDSREVYMVWLTSILRSRDNFKSFWGLPQQLLKPEISSIHGVVKGIFLLEIVWFQSFRIEKGYADNELNSFADFFKLHTRCVQKD
jgi:hypothetical protein